MDMELGKTLEEIAQRVAGLDRALAGAVAVHDRIFRETRDWRSLLTYKLIPHFQGRGCLIAAVTGGTNTGKSTVFNLLLGASVSPVEATAAATRHPLLAGCARRAQQCLEGRLVPEFATHPLDDRLAVIQETGEDATLYVVETAVLPDHLVLLDTPDVDSIERRNWSVAENIRSAGDVLVAVVSPEKYKDDRVVSFFRKARASGRVVVPVMNKANPEGGFAVARRQLTEFQQDIGGEGPVFVLPHDFNLGHHVFPIVEALDGQLDLRSYLEQLDVKTIKSQVYAETVKHFADNAGQFVRDVRNDGQALSATARYFERQAAEYASRYDPEPGSEVGGLFHDFVQSKRGPLRRAIGTMGAWTSRGVRSVGRAVHGRFVQGATLGSAPQPATQRQIEEQHRRELERIARDMAAACVEQCRAASEPAAPLLAQALAQWDSEAAVRAAVAQSLRKEGVSQAFREHAWRTLDEWWTGHKGRRRALEALDAILAVVPTAIAAPISIYTGGIGVPEAIALSGPFIEQFVARVVEYQFGDAMFDFLSPWKRDQQRVFEQALHEHLVAPLTRQLSDLAETLDGADTQELERLVDQCRTAC